MNLVTHLIPLSGSIAATTSLVVLMATNSFAQSRQKEVCGTVIEAGTRARIKNARVRLEELDRRVEAVRMEGVSSEDGRFCFDVPPNKGYRLSAFASGYADRAPSGTRGVNVIVSDSEVPPSVEVVLYRSASIEGTVHGDKGVALKGARVALIAERAQFGRMIWAESFGAHTDSNGEYRISGISPGNYLITVKARLIDLDYGEMSGRGAYPPFFLESTDEPDAARVVRIKAGDGISSLDLRLARRIAATLTGRVNGIPANAKGDVTLLKSGRLGSVVVGRAAIQGGQYSIRGAVSGRYFLRAVVRYERAAWIGIKAISVNANNEQRVILEDVDANAPTIVDIKLVSPNQEVRRRLHERTKVILVPLGTFLGDSMPLPQSQDHLSWTFPGMEPGDYQIRLLDADPGLMLKGSDVLRINAGENTLAESVEVVTGGSVVSGQVRDEAGRAVGTAAVHLVPVDPSTWGAANVRAVLCDDSGSFEIPNVAPNEYRLAVMGVGFIPSVYDEESRQHILERGQRIRTRPDELLNVTLVSK